MTKVARPGGSSTTWAGCLQSFYQYRKGQQKCLNFILNKEQEKENMCEHLTRASVEIVNKHFCSVHALQNMHSSWVCFLSLTACVETREVYHFHLENIPLTLFLFGAYTTKVVGL